MSTFGIRTEEFGEGDEHYVGADEVLLDWLLANNYEPSDRDSNYLVRAPDGYTFNRGSLVRKEESKLQTSEDVSDFAYVSFGSPENDKAIMLLDGAMIHVKRAQFDALGIAEERILDYMIY
jgi:hypothetical protein